MVIINNFAVVQYALLNEGPWGKLKQKTELLEGWLNKRAASSWLEMRALKFILAM